MQDLGRWLVIVGGVLVVAGVVVMVGARFGLGRLPGDFSFTVGRTRVFAPIATSIVLSIILTVLLNLFLRR